MGGDRIQVRVHILPWFSERLEPRGTAQRHGTVSLEEALPPGSTLRALLQGLAGRYPGLGEALFFPEGGGLQAGVVVTHNGRLVAATDGLDLVLEDGDALSLIPSYPGG
jgi:molybdopterin converting factor small subunit